MELKHIKGIGPAKQEKLAAAGIKDVQTLARADVAKLAKDTGLSQSTIKEYKEKAVAATLLEDIKGIGPATLQSLAESGIVGLKEFYSASSERIAAELKIAQEKANAMQAQAVEMASRIAADAKTSEGRKKLAGESKDLALKVSEATQKAAVDLYARVKKDGESAISKAKALREDAPAKVSEARAKAEAALKEAESKIKTLQSKIPEATKDVQAKAEKAVADARAKVDELAATTQSFVKTEVEKVKAANEGLLGKLKARFGKKDA